MNRLSLQHGGYHQHIEHGGVCARADTDLIYLLTRELRDRPNVVGAVGAGREGAKRAEVNRQLLVIDSIGVGKQRDIVSRSSLCAEEGEGVLV